jgi:hypothetical protein
MKLACATGDQADRTVISVNKFARNEVILKKLLGRKNQSMRMQIIHAIGSWLSMYGNFDQSVSGSIQSIIT